MSLTITQFLPVNVLPCQTVNVSGTGFLAAAITSVTIGGVAATSFLIVSDSEMTVVAGAGNSGIISITNSASETAMSAEFIYVNSASPVPADISLIDNTYYNFISSFTGEPFTVNIAPECGDGNYVKEDWTSITDSDVDNIVYFKFDDGKYGIRNWPDNVVNAAEFGMRADSYFNLTTTYPTKNCDSLVIGTVNDFGPFCTYLSMGNKTGLIPSNKEATCQTETLPATSQVYFTNQMMKLTGNNIILRIEGDIIAVFDIPSPPPSPLQTSLLYVHTLTDAPISNVRIIGNGSTLDMSGQAIPWTYTDTEGPGICTILFDGVINGYIENLTAVNGLVDCIKMHACQNPVLSGVTVSGSVNDNGITIINHPLVGFDPDNPKTYTNGLVVNCKAFNCEDYGITSFAARNTHIINCESWNCGTDAYCDGAPQGIAISQLSTGGALPAGTYYYVITSINGMGVESPKSSEVHDTVSGTTSSIQLSWTDIPGDKYLVYRGIVSNIYTEYYNCSSNMFDDVNAAGAITKFQFDNIVASGGGFSDEVNNTADDYNEPTGTLFENCKAVNSLTNGLLSDSTYVRIRGLIIDGVSSSSTDFWQGHGISLLGNTNFIVDGCDIHGSDEQTPGFIPKNGISASYSSSHSVDPTDYQYPHGIISNNKISNCDEGGVAVHGCDFINCYGNTLTATNQTNINNGVGAEINIVNSYDSEVGNAGQGTVIIKDNSLTSPSGRSVFVNNIKTVYIEDNIIDGSSCSASVINVNSNAGTIESVAIKGNTLQNVSTLPSHMPSHIANITVQSTGAVYLVTAMGNTADLPISQPYDFSAAAASVIEYDDRYLKIGTALIDGVDYSIPDNISTVILADVTSTRQLTLPDPTAYTGRVISIHTKYVATYGVLSPFGWKLATGSEFVSAGEVGFASILSPDVPGTTSSYLLDKNVTYILSSDGTYWWDINGANVKNRLVRLSNNTTTTYYLSSSDSVLILDSSDVSTDMIVYLPSAGDITIRNHTGKGSKIFTVRHIANGTTASKITLQIVLGGVGQIISGSLTGAASFDVPVFGMVSFASDGSNWYILDQFNNNNSISVQSSASASFTINLTHGSLVTLLGVTTAQTVTFPVGSDGLVFTIWAQTGTGAIAWGVGSSVSVIDATGATITSLAPGAFYRFVYYVAIPSWVKMS